MMGVERNECSTTWFISDNERLHKTMGSWSWRGTDHRSHSLWSTLHRYPVPEHRVRFDLLLIGFIFTYFLLLTLICLEGIAAEMGYPW